MYININITPATETPSRRARLCIELKAPPWERYDLFEKGCLSRVIVPASYAGRDLTIGNLLDKPTIIHLRTTAMAEAVAAVARIRARDVADDHPDEAATITPDTSIAEVGHV